MRERVSLIVDDEPEIRTYLRVLLECQGIQSVEAENAAEALRILQKLGSQIGLLITDIQMPGNADGNVVAQEAKAKSDLSIVYMTGNPSSLTQSLRPYDALILKPFSPGELMIIVQRLLSLRIG